MVVPILVGGDLQYSKEMEISRRPFPLLHPSSVLKKFTIPISSYGKFFYGEFIYGYRGI